MSAPTTGKKTMNPILKKLLLLLLILILLGALYLVTGILASRHIEVNAYQLETDISQPLRIVQLSDLHNKKFGPDNNELVEKVKEQNPDLLVFTGDMVAYENLSLNVVTNLIQQLKEVAPVYYGLGNHEYWQIRTYARDFVTPTEEAGGMVLNTKFIHIDVNGNDICLGGCPFPYRNGPAITKDKDVLNMIEGWCAAFEAEPGYHILLNHTPTSVLENNGTDEYPVELYFSGDYHGGIFRIPIIDRGVYVPDVGLFPKHTKGLVQGEKGTLVISAGLGDAHHIPRVFNPPEIVVVDLMPKES